MNKRNSKHLDGYYLKCIAHKYYIQFHNVNVEKNAMNALKFTYGNMSEITLRRRMRMVLTKIMFYLHMIWSETI